MRDSIGFQIEIFKCILKIIPISVFMFHKGLSCLICNVIHPSIPSPAHSLTFPFFPSFNCPPSDPPVHPLIHLPTYSPTYPSIYPSIQPSIHPPLYPSIHPTAFHVANSILDAEHPMTHHLHIVSHAQSDLPLPLSPFKCSPVLISNSNPSSPLKAALTTLIHTNSV